LTWSAPDTEDVVDSGRVDIVDMVDGKKGTSFWFILSTESTMNFSLTID